MQNRNTAASSALAMSVGAPRRSTLLRSEEHTSELQSHSDLVCRLLLEKKKPRTTLKTTPAQRHPGQDLPRLLPDLGTHPPHPPLSHAVSSHPARAYVRPAPY